MSNKSLTKDEIQKILILHNSGLYSLDQIAKYFYITIEQLKSIIINDTSNFTGKEKKHDVNGSLNIESTNEQKQIDQIKENNLKTNDRQTKLKNEDIENVLVDRDIIKKIIDLYVYENYGLNRLANKFNISTSQLKKLLIENHIEIETNRTAWTFITNSNTADKIIKLYTEKKFSIKKISEEMDISEFSVKKILQDANIPIRTYRQKKDISKEMQEKIIDLYVKEEWTISAIGKYFGIAEKYISKVLRDNKIEIEFFGLKSRITAEDIEPMYKEKVIELREQGHTARSIAAELNLTYKKVVDIIANYLESNK